MANVFRAGNSSESMIEYVFRDPCRYVQRSRQNLALRRIDQADVETVLADLLGNSVGGDDEHLVRHPLGFGRIDCHSHGGEDVDVVTLAWHEMLAADGQWGKRTAARKDRTTFRPGIRFLRRAFRPRRRVGVREDDRPLVDLRNGLDDFLVEKFWDCAYADDAGRPQCLDRLGKVAYRRVLDRIRLLKVHELSR